MPRMKSYEPTASDKEQYGSLVSLQFEFDPDGQAEGANPLTICGSGFVIDFQEQELIITSAWYFDRNFKNVTITVNSSFIPAWFGSVATWPAVRTLIRLDKEDTYNLHVADSYLSADPNNDWMAIRYSKNYGTIAYKGTGVDNTVIMPPWVSAITDDSLVMAGNALTVAGYDQNRKLNAATGVVQSSDSSQIYFETNVETAPSNRGGLVTVVESGSSTYVGVGMVSEGRRVTRFHPKMIREIATWLRMKPLTAYGEDTQISEAYRGVCKLNMQRKSTPKFYSSGTGFLVTHNDRLFLLTAGHVLPELMSDLESLTVLVGKNGDYYQHRFVVTDHSKMHRSNNYVPDVSADDWAVVKLDIASDVEATLISYELEINAAPFPAGTEVHAVGYHGTNYLYAGTGLTVPNAQSATEVIRPEILLASGDSGGPLFRNDKPMTVVSILNEENAYAGFSALIRSAVIDEIETWLRTF